MSIEKTYRAECPESLDEIARDLLDAFPASRVFAISGPMGVGKTTFIQALCRALGITDTVSSPTFSMINHYKDPRGKDIFHFDFYRVNKLEELYDIGYEEYVYSGNYCFVEWPEMMDHLLPEHSIRVGMEETEKGTRVIRTGIEQIPFLR